MKTTLTAVVAAMSLAMAASAMAQGRHDEKPHGMAKQQASQDNERKSRPMTGGRHDERPHGMVTPEKRAPANPEKGAK